MAQSFVVWARTRRYVRLWFRDAFAQTIALLTDTNARLNYIGVFVVLFLLSHKWSLEKLSSWVGTTFDSIEKEPKGSDSIESQLRYRYLIIMSWTQRDCYGFNRV